MLYTPIRSERKGGAFWKGEWCHEGGLQEEAEAMLKSMRLCLVNIVCPVNRSRTGSLMVIMCVFHAFPPRTSSTIGRCWFIFFFQDIIYHRKALIHFPYEMSTMSLAEQYSAGVCVCVCVCVYSAGASDMCVHTHTDKYIYAYIHISYIYIYIYV